MPARLVVLISGTGSNMTALADACARGEVGADVVAVVADRQCEGLSRARERGIEAIPLEPSWFASRPDWDRALCRTVMERRPDLVVSAGFMRILGPSFVDAFAPRLINLHPSLLPALPGAHAVRDALEGKVEVTGTTIHVIDHDVDQGPILAQEAVRVHPSDTEASLHARIKDVEHRLLPETCRRILSGDIRLPP